MDDDFRPPLEDRGVPDVRLLRDDPVLPLVPAEDCDREPDVLFVALEADDVPFARDDAEAVARVLEDFVFVPDDLEPAEVERVLDAGLLVEFFVEPSRAVDRAREEPEARTGRFLRFPFAVSRNCSSDMDSAMPREAPLRDALLRSPRFADNAAPAAICCFFDFAGMPECERAHIIRKSLM